MRHAPTIVVVCFAALALSFPLSDTDIWWHLAAGRAMVGAFSWLRTDPFCVSSLGAPWTDLHWGFQLIVLAWERLGGETALVALRVVLVVAALWIALRDRMGWGPAIVAMLVIFQTRTFLDLRPLLVSLVALALLWILLEAKPSSATLAGTVVLQVVLVNTQGLFILGPLFAFASGVGAAIEGRRRVASTHAVLAVGLLAVSLANPWGWHAFDLALEVALRIVPSATNLFSREIPENLPLHLWIRQDPTRTILLAWIASAAWIFRRRGTGSAGRALLLAGTGALACMAVRNLPLLGIALLLSVEPGRPRLPRITALAGWAVPLVLAVPLLLERRWNDPSTSIAPFRLPSPRLLSPIERKPGRIFHEIRAGGWLSWKLPGRTACWCDTRLVLHDAAFVADYLDVMARPDRFEAWSRERDFRFALLPTAEMPHASALVSTLFASPSWTLLDFDGAWALFARADGETRGIDWRVPEGRAAMDAAMRERLGDNPRLERLAAGRLGEILDRATEAPLQEGSR